jgi:cAMP-dependent protein kinase regulator
MNILNNKVKEFLSIIFILNQIPSAGTKVIVQGDDGDCMYLIDSGQLDCYRRATKDGDDKKIKAYQPGEAFGELALLYNAPRAV